MTLMSKSKKALETSLDLTTLFKTSVGIRVEDLVLIVGYLENWHLNFTQKKYGRKRHLLRTYFVLWTVIFLFVRTFYTTDDS